MGYLEDQDGWPTAMSLCFHVFVLAIPGIKLSTVFQIWVELHRLAAAIHTSQVKTYQRFSESDSLGFISYWWGDIWGFRMGNGWLKHFHPAVALIPIVLLNHEGAVYQGYSGYNQVQTCWIAIEYISTRASFFGRCCPCVCNCNDFQFCATAEHLWIVDCEILPNLFLV